ncbi:MAG: Peptidase, partial [Myxococcaceae bacterium]|nr:Peptidase [Myxococcaceae bacterium]
VDRWVLVGAHYDHLGTQGKAVYRGADDNAASVGILVDVARALAAKRPDGRGVIFVAFDGEEPPFYDTGAMGSQDFVRAPAVPLDRIGMMVAMELLGHPIGPDGLPDAVRSSVFALGAERSAGTSARVDALASAVDGVTVRRTDAEVIPPLSDHLAFWQARVPFMLLTGTRSAAYHTPWDTPDRLDWNRVGAVSRWLEAFVRDQCAPRRARALPPRRPGRPLHPRRHVRPPATAGRGGSAGALGARPRRRALRPLRRPRPPRRGRAHRPPGHRRRRRVGPRIGPPLR